MRITGLVFIGTRTDDRESMARFVRDVLGLTLAELPGIDADLFDLPDGSVFAVAAAEQSPTERTVGFIVEDLDAAEGELRAANVEMDDTISENEHFRYVHFRAPDGRLYELVESSGD